MNPNIGKKERFLRIVIGAGITSLAVFGPAHPWFLLGLIPVVTGVVGWCPPYQVLGINTCPVSADKKADGA